MAVTSDPYTAGDLVAVINEVWTPITNEALFAKTVFANFVVDLSPYMAEGGDIAHVPDFYTNTFSVQTQSTQGAEITTESVATVDTTLTVDTHKYIAIAIGDLSMQQIASKYNVSEIYAREMGNLLAKALEDSLAGLWSSITTNTIGDTATVLSDAEIRQAINKLASTNFDLSECAFFVHPYVYWNQLHAIAKYYDMSQSGFSAVLTGNFGSGAAREAGRWGTLYGIPMFVTSNVVSGLQTYRNLLLHKSALGFAVQTKGGSKVRVQASNEVRNLATLVVADLVYGVAALRETAGVLLNASSAFIGS